MESPEKRFSLKISPNKYSSGKTKTPHNEGLSSGGDCAPRNLNQGKAIKMRMENGLKRLRPSEFESRQSTLVCNPVFTAETAPLGI